jgi:UDP-GlcNAc3NAcA epimerase
VTEVLVHTGQHYDDDMSGVFFAELGIPDPDYNLGIGSGSHGAQTGRMLAAVEEVLLTERPTAVLVYGDTNSTLAGALAAAKLRIPVAHVEAGLRSYNRAMPEEINRVLTDHLSEQLLAPTSTAVENLRREGIAPKHIHLVGDVMYDAALYYAKQAEAGSKALKRLGLTPGEYALATIHRAENTDDPRRLSAIMAGLTRLSSALPVVLPLHPRTRNVLEARGEPLSLAPGLKVTAPVSYLDMVMLEAHARVIVTDSGGVQKEAYFHSVPCVTLRDETEWVELVEAGWNRLVPPSSGQAVHDGIREVLDAGRPSSRDLLYGDGTASQKIVTALLRAFMA